MFPSVSKPGATLSPGSRIGKYEVVRTLARGGMAELYLVKNLGLHSFESLAVLKRLPPHYLVSEPNVVNMFLDEAQLTASLRHPNIAQVFDFGEDADSYFFVMEYVEGLSLAQLQKKCRMARRRFPLAMAVQIVLGVAEALEAAHDARDAQGQPLELVHRDVSPQNVIVTAHGSIKLIDFGIARARQRRERTETGFIKGKYAYMSPEQIRAEPVDRQSDLFSLGLLLYELTTMKRPHEDTVGPAMAYVRSEIDCPDPRTVCEGYSEELAGIVNRLLSRDRSERFKTAREVHEALRLFSATEGLSLSPFTLREWVEGIDAPLARGSGSWMGQDAEVRAPSLNERLPRALTNQPTSVMRGLALEASTRAATQYDFEVLEEQEEFDDQPEAKPVARAKNGRGRRIAGLIVASFFVGLCVLVALLAVQGQLDYAVSSALELLPS